LSRTIRLQGHLLDSGLINRALDRIVEGGGSFQVLDFALGQQRHSTSSAAIRVSAPDGEVMADLMARLIALGALATADGECDAALAEVLQDGVAPDDFYVSTIYPTEVRLAGRWHRVGRQRMDGALVLRPDVPESTALARVECRLLRDLRAGEQVVVGVALPDAELVLVVEGDAPGAPRSSRVSDASPPWGHPSPLSQRAAATSAAAAPASV
jgi:hypothetical protein